MKPRLKPATRFVYVIGPTAGLQKIGLTTDPRSRLAALQTASPVALVLHVAVAVPFGEAHAIEQAAHRALADLRAAGEWFETTPAEAVAAVHAAAQVAQDCTPPPAAPLPLFAFERAPAAPLIGSRSPSASWPIFSHVRRAIGWPERIAR